uniref:Uncharacterized protein n=1 Tax=Timema monikensis TaxID=170555 RepID=A0A7R9EH49_9NEOP|nr:unnamed protein product [Timema monikensis]
MRPPKQAQSEREENHLGKTTPSSPDRDSNLDLPVLSSELNTTSALANYTTEAGAVTSKYLRSPVIKIVNESHSLLLSRDDDLSKPVSARLVFAEDTPAVDSVHRNQ